MKGRKKMIIVWGVTIIAAVVIFATAWHFLFGMPNPPLSQGQVTISLTTVATSSVPAASSTASSSVPEQNSSKDQLRIDGATWHIEFATTTVEQARGLSYRASLGTNDGMLFIFNNPSVQNFWMIGMNFPLDMIWIGDDGSGGSKVLGFAQNVPAPASGTATWNLPIYSSPDGVNKVLEVNAGSVAKYNIKVGDEVVISLPSAL
jgi:uncharacterized membrane protein (UPF0127 family)